VRVLVIAGAGNDFWSGGDIRTMGPDVPAAATADSTRACIQATHEWHGPMSKRQHFDTGHRKRSTTDCNFALTLKKPSANSRDGVLTQRALASHS
jgi:hypothetical protein